GFLEQAGGRAAGTRDHVIGVGLALIDQALTVLRGLVRVLEGGLHLLGRLRLLDRHVDHADAYRVSVEDALDLRERVDRHLLLLLVEHLVDALAADDLAHRGLGRLANDLLGNRTQVVVEKVVARVADPVLDRELKVDDALVKSQDQRLAQRLVADRISIADLDRAQLLGVDDLVRLDRVRQAPGEAGPVDEVLELAETHHRRSLAFLDDVEAAAEPQQHGDHGQQADAGAGSFHRGATAAARIGRAARTVRAAALLAEQAVEPPVEVAPQLIEIGRAVALAGTLRRALLVTAATLAPAGVVK